MTRSQHGFVKNRPCQTNFIAFFDKVTKLVDQENAVDIVYLDFSKVDFDKVDHWSPTLGLQVFLDYNSQKPSPPALLARISGS